MGETKVQNNGHVPFLKRSYCKSAPGGTRPRWGKKTLKAKIKRKWLKGTKPETKVKKKPNSTAPSLLRKYPHGVVELLTQGRW